MEVVYCVFDRAEDGRIHNVTGISDGEDVAKLLIEDDFRRHSGVRAREDNCDRLLGACQSLTVGLVVGWALLLQKVACVTALQNLQRFLRIRDECGWLVIHVGAFVARHVILVSKLAAHNEVEDAVWV